MVDGCQCHGREFCIVVKGIGLGNATFKALFSYEY